LWWDADIANTTDTDIKSIKVVLGGVGFNATNDKLILDTDITLRGDITATNKAIPRCASFNEAVAEADSLFSTSV
jgi:hypothetical protein